MQANTNSKKQKLYCYVDETGQDTKGDWFLVAVVIVADKKDEIEKILMDIEYSSGKHKTKWRKTKHERRESYIDKIKREIKFKNCFYYSVYKNTTLYPDMVVLTTAKAILDKAHDDYTALITVDGLKPNLEKIFAVSLRRLKIKTEKVKGARDESSPFVRLADSLAGFARDAFENQKWAKESLDKLSKKGFIHEV